MHSSSTPATVPRTDVGTLPRALEGVVPIREHRLSGVFLLEPPAAGEIRRRRCLPAFHSVIRQVVGDAVVAHGSLDFRDEEVDRIGELPVSVALESGSLCCLEEQKQAGNVSRRGGGGEALQHDQARFLGRERGRFFIRQGVFLYHLMAAHPSRLVGGQNPSRLGPDATPGEYSRGVRLDRGRAQGQRRELRTPELSHFQARTGLGDHDFYSVRIASPRTIKALQKSLQDVRLRCHLLLA
mmetsp:Transcript_24788/g.65172  ORF Transcript_24788/g.65172 Transcript_24788/m.65172 type:complete len:240 (-) Transcript_24788:19-738(-)